MSTDVKDELKEELVPQSEAEVEEEQEDEDEQEDNREEQDVGAENVEQQGDNPLAPAGVSSQRSPSVWQRLLQKTSIFIIVFSLLGPFWYWPLTLFLLWLHPYTAGLMIGYILYICGPSHNACYLPGDHMPLRRLGLWYHFASYFDLKLIKTVELDPQHSYMFCPHPHGIASLSHTANFITESTGFSNNFPGIKLHPLVLESHFFAPFHRELALLAGMRASSKKAITNILNAGDGCSVLLIPGGAEEALMSYPGTYDLILTKRKGFIKLALQTGAQLVPILAFGETDLYDVTRPDPKSWTAYFQRKFLAKFGFALPKFSGVGFFGGTGSFPKPGAVTTVVGAPVPVARHAGPYDTPEFHQAVDTLHAQYCAALRGIWDEHKHTLAPTRRKSMEFVK